jgi:hypothetical protein
MKYYVSIVFSQWSLIKLRDILYTGQCYRRYGYSRERFVWSLFSDVGIFCLGCGATIVHGVQNLATPEVFVSFFMSFWCSQSAILNYPNIESVHAVSASQQTFSERSNSSKF